MPKQRKPQTDTETLFTGTLSRLLTPDVQRKELIKGLPPIPESPFGESPTVIGSSELAREVEGLLNIAPKLRTRLRRVVAGPTKGSLKQASPASHLIYPFPPRLFGLVNSIGGDEISVDPMLADKPGQQLRRVLAHEMSHIAGGEHSTGEPFQADEMVEILGDKLIPKKAIQRKSK